MEVNRETIQKYNVQMSIMAAYIEELELNNKQDLEVEEEILLGKLISLKNEMIRYLEDVKYLEGKYYEGELGINDFGKYYIKYIDDNGTLNINHYSCGNRIEIKLNDPDEDKLKWYVGTVEHDGTYYYFTGHSLKPRLQTGMKVRYRE